MPADRDQFSEPLSQEPVSSLHREVQGTFGCYRPIGR